MLSVLTICAYGFASFQNPGGASGPCPMASVPSSSNDCVECPAGKTNYAAGETTCTYAFSTAAAPDYYQDGLNLVEAKGNIQARFRLPHADAFSGDATCTQTKYRSADGSCTRLSVPLDGAANTPFGRLMEVDFTNEVDDPPAAAVAAAFLHRPANASRVSSGAHSAMVTAWIQFMIHDWIPAKLTRRPSHLSAVHTTGCLTARPHALYTYTPIGTRTTQCASRTLKLRTLAPQDSALRFVLRW